MAAMTPNPPAEDIAQYLEQVLLRRKAFDPDTKGAGEPGPEYWADAPWRLEPGVNSIPLTFIARDAWGKNLHHIKVSQCTHADSGACSDVESNLDQLVPPIKGPGKITRNYWSASVHYLQAPPTLVQSKEWSGWGQRILLRIQFYDPDGEILHDQHLSILRARHSLPLRDHPQWYYGDTHYHSAYTCDLKEFGNPIPDTKEAAQSIGLDWLIVTDHSVDIKDENPYWPDTDSLSRWKALGAEIEANSDNDDFRLVRGEEVSVRGKPRLLDATLHLLVFGGDFDPIPGAFFDMKHMNGVFDQFGLLSFKQGLTYLFGKIHSLRAVLTGRDEDGNEIEALRLCNVSSQGLLALAAHPFSGAQSPLSKWEEEDLLQPILGAEAWNARVRRHSGNQDDPFGDWVYKQPDYDLGNDPIRKWAQNLKSRVNDPTPQFVLVGGSDAHGSFNYSVNWGVAHDGLVADDNALGKVRTLLYLPLRLPGSKRKAPSQQEIAQAIRSGSCVVTDGPVVSFRVCFQEQCATLGQTLDHLDSHGDLVVEVQTKSTDEFGAIKDIDIWYYFTGMEAEARITMPVADPTSFPVYGGAGYIRLETRTYNGEEDFRCVTNPIWIRFDTPGEHQARVVVMNLE